MGIFKITADDFKWITGAADDPGDRCLHGHVTVTIGGTTMEGDGTVSATALYLLKSLTEDHISSKYDIQMVPCCGHFLIANEELSEVTIIGCDTGLDWTIRHKDGQILLTAPGGEETAVEYYDYVYEVCHFADMVERYYSKCTPKILPDDEFERNGYIVFWNEWHRRYREAQLKKSLAAGREIELRHDGLHYFISRDSDTAWYLYCEETQEKQVFASADALYAQAHFGKALLKDELTNLTIDCIL